MHRLALIALAVTTGACVLLDFDGYAVDGADGGAHPHSGGAGGGTGGQDGGSGGTPTTTTTSPFGEPVVIDPGAPVFDIASNDTRVCWIIETAVACRTLYGEDWSAPLTLTPSALAADGTHVYVAVASGGDHTIQRSAIGSAVLPQPWANALPFTTPASELMVRGPDLVVVAQEGYIVVRTSDGTHDPLQTVPNLGHLTAHSDAIYGYADTMVYRFIGNDGTVSADLRNTIFSIAVNDTAQFVAFSDSVRRYDDVIAAPDHVDIASHTAECMAADDEDLYVVTDNILGRLPASGTGPLVTYDRATFPKCRKLVLTQDALFIWFDNGIKLTGVPRNAP